MQTPNQRHAKIQRRIWRGRGPRDRPSAMMKGVEVCRDREKKRETERPVEEGKQYEDSF